MQMAAGLLTEITASMADKWSATTADVLYRMMLTGSEIMTNLQKAMSKPLVLRTLAAAVKLAVTIDDSCCTWPEIACLHY